MDNHCDYLRFRSFSLKRLHNGDIHMQLNWKYVLYIGQMLSTITSHG